MNRNFVWVACLVMTLALGAMPGKASARTDVSINLRIGDPYRGPRLVFEDEPNIVVVPGTRVYYVRDCDYDVYRYGSTWYYNYDGGWYRSRRYNGPYTYIGYRSVPHPVAYVPVRYRRHWRDYNEGPRRYQGEDRGWHRGEGRGHGHGHGHHGDGD